MCNISCFPVVSATLFLYRLFCDPVLFFVNECCLDEMRDDEEDEEFRLIDSNGCDDMAPDAEDCETAQLNTDYNVPTHQSHRVNPEQAAPAQAWTESEELDRGERSPGENRRLLPTPAPEKNKSRIQAGLTLGVHSKYPQKQATSKNNQKTRFQKRKEKLKKVLRPPYFILTMIMVLVAIHLFAPESLHAQMEWMPTAWRRQPWRLFTYGLVHASAAHLALNALVAFAVGWRLEREQGWWRVMCVWASGLCCGALGAGVLQPTVKVVGASAAVYALLTSHLPNVCLRFGYIPLWWFRPLSVVVLGASEGCWALMRTPADGSGAAHARLSYDHVAWAAHLLGAAVGVPLAFIVFSGENSKKRHNIAARIVSALLLIVGAALAIVHYTFWVDAEGP